MGEIVSSIVHAPSHARETPTLSLDEALLWVRRAYETGWQHGCAKSRIIVTDEGLVDGQDAAADAVRAALAPTNKDQSRC